MTLRKPTHDGWVVGDENHVSLHFLGADHYAKWQRSRGIAQEADIMIRVSVLYPNGDGTKFDMTYYTGKHMPMVRQKLGKACKCVAIDAGVEGAQPGSKPAFVAMCHLEFDSVEAFQAAFGPHATAILADIPNYTNVQPTIQISEVKL